jgi:hypothetical protein
MKKQPKQKLSINKETIRRLTPTELTLVRGGDVTEVPPNPNQGLVGTYDDCMQ